MPGIRGWIVSGLKVLHMVVFKSYTPSLGTDVIDFDSPYLIKIGARSFRTCCNEVEFGGVFGQSPKNTPNFMHSSQKFPKTLAQIIVIQRKLRYYWGQLY